MFFGLNERKLAAPEDIIIIAGDAGFVMDEEYPLKIHTLERLFPGTVCFVDGNHDNHEILRSLPETEWQGGRVHRAGERVLHLMRGELYEIGGENYFTLGGARTVGNFIEDLHRWEGEEPSPEELERAERVFSENLDRIDYVITHEAPLCARGGLNRTKPLDGDYALPDVLQEWFDRASAGARLKKWYFGHMHEDRKFGPKLQAIYNQVVAAGSGTALRWH